jgi:hypothetical protein
MTIGRRRLSQSNLLLSALLIFITSPLFHCTNPPPKCGSGLPCIFVNRDIGWIPRNENISAISPPPIRSNSWQSNDTVIFVAISSFRDKLCPVTLFNMYTKAFYPHRIHTAVIQQNIPGDLDCLEEYCRLMKVRADSDSSSGSSSNTGPGSSTGDGSWNCPFIQNIQMKRLDGNTARGPTWARSFASEMIDGEFCLQTDSHMDYAVGWDNSMLGMWGLVNNEYAVLSTYVTDTTDYNNIKDHSKGPSLFHHSRPTLSLSIYLSLSLSQGSIICTRSPISASSCFTGCGACPETSEQNASACFQNQSSRMLSGEPASRSRNAMPREKSLTTHTRRESLTVKSGLVLPDIGPMATTFTLLIVFILITTTKAHRSLPDHSPSTPHSHSLHSSLTRVTPLTVRGIAVEPLSKSLILWRGYVICFT